MKKICLVLVLVVSACSGVFAASAERSSISIEQTLRNWVKEKAESKSFLPCFYISQRSRLPVDTTDAPAARAWYISSLCSISPPAIIGMLVFDFIFDMDL